MLKKMILPLFAVAFAVIGAFASPVFSQMGWFKNSSGNAVQGTITTPGDVPPCLTTNVDHICKVGSANAYFTQADAQAGGTTNLLKYNDN